jgi:membrane-associated phospholipid phosphatase
MVLGALACPAIASGSTLTLCHHDPFFIPRWINLQAPLAAAASPPSLVRAVGTDFKNAFTVAENLVILGAGLGAAGLAGQFDERIASGSPNREIDRGTAADPFFEPGHVIGASLVQFGGAIATYGLGRVFSRKKAEDLGRDLIRAQVVTGTLTLGAKAAVGRKRPDGTNRRSFPSGHASGTFATATVLHRHYGWKVGVPAYAVASYVAASRINHDQHYLSDVVFGAAVGILVGRTVTVRLGRGRLRVNPMHTAGGLGVELIWLGACP